MADEHQNKTINKYARYLRSQQNIELKLKKFEKQNRYQLLFCIIVFSLMAYVVIHQPIYIEPYGLDKKVKLSINRLDPYYLMKLARDDAQTYFDVTPQTISGASDIFLTRVEPKFFGETEVALKKREKDYRNDNKSTVFFPENKAQVMTDIVTLKGNLLTFIGDKITNRKAIVLTVTYDIDGGKAYIKRWNYV